MSVCSCVGGGWPVTGECMVNRSLGGGCCGGRWIVGVERLSNGGQRVLGGCGGVIKAGGERSNQHHIKTEMSNC